MAQTIGAASRPTHFKEFRDDSLGEERNALRHWLARSIDLGPISITTIVVFLHGAYSGRKKTCYRVMCSSLRSCKV